jgi:hypothetical protein
MAVKVPASRSFTGFVYVGAEGDRERPMDSAKIQLWRVGASKPLLIVTGSDGRFGDMSVGPGDYNFIVCADGGFTTLGGRVTISRSGSEAPIEFWIQPDT